MGLRPPTPAVLVTVSSPHITASSTMAYTISAGSATLASSYLCASPGCGVFTLVTVSSTSGRSTSGPNGTDERQNFANWYSYYRTRILMMKSAAGLVFKNIDNGYRVGFTTISYTGVDSTNPDFLQIADFDSPQKTSWYSKFYAITPTGSTPLRVALAKAGRIYAGQLLTGANDPVQYSCQQNFTILSTDGYWNDSTNPTQINGTTAIGEQDGPEVRPMYDGAGVSYGMSTSQIQESQTQKTKDTTAIQKRTTQIQSSSSTLQKQTSQLQQDIGALQSQTSQLQTADQHAAKPDLAIGETDQLAAKPDLAIADADQHAANADLAVADTDQFVAVADFTVADADQLAAIADFAIAGIHQPFAIEHQQLAE